MSFAADSLNVHKTETVKAEEKRLDPNYRNYSVLSKVVKESSTYGRAIDSHLKVMQEAQRTLRYTLNSRDNMQSPGPSEYRAE